MLKHELLVPAGNMDCLRQAVFNGCDAVYLACKNFGARKFANNFTNEEIIDAIRFCHLYGVRIYVTMNTLVKNHEVDAFLEQASFLHQHGVDALIVQDFGMICLLREMFPNLEIHASTQANISSREVCQLYYDLGVKRVVFSRELTVNEIDAIDVPIEKEAFIHGALCISYSGCCLMSSMLGGRSGNRGECAGVCRMPFSLLKDGKVIQENAYLLSTKELNTSSHIQRLLDSSIYSFKIEGRMKSPFYVGFITRLYRRLMDQEEFSLEEQIDSLKTIFNREFTAGRMFDATDSSFMNTKSPNHVGLEIGKVLQVSKDKIKIQLNPGRSLHQGDAIRFLNAREGFIVNYLYDQNDKLISSSDSICYVDNKVGLKDTDIVSKTQDFLLEKEYSELKSRKIPISFHIEMVCGEKIKVEISDGEHSIIQYGDIVQQAKNAPLQKEDVERQFSKLGDTPFVCQELDIQMDSNLFLPIRSLNEIRRLLVDELIAARECKKVEFVQNKVLFDKTEILEKVGNYSCLVYTEEQLNACLEHSIDFIYVVGEELYSKYKNYPNIYYMVPRCSYLIQDLLRERNLVSDYGYFSNDCGNYPLNVTNIYTAYYLKRLGLSSICLSVELTEEEILSFIQSYEEKFGSYSFEVMVYGRVENMIIKGNILSLDIHKIYELKDSKNRIFPVYYDGRLTHILNCENKKMDMVALKGKCRLRFDFFQETSEEINHIL